LILLYPSFLLLIMYFFQHLIKQMLNIHYSINLKILVQVYHCLSKAISYIVINKHINKLLNHKFPVLKIIFSWSRYFKSIWKDQRNPLPTWSLTLEKFNIVFCDVISNCFVFLFFWKDLKIASAICYCSMLNVMVCNGEQKQKRDSR
jgi:hypothetical protein